MTHNLLPWIAVIFYALAGFYFSLQFFLKKEKTGTLAVLFLLLGIFTHGVDLAGFGLEQHRFPAANLTEASSLLLWVVLLVFTVMVASRSEAARSLGVIVLPLAIIAVGVNAVTRSNEPPLQPMLRG